MKTKKLFLPVLFVLCLFTASLSTSARNSSDNQSKSHITGLSIPGKTSDTTDTNPGGGGPIPPVGH